MKFAVGTIAVAVPVVSIQVVVVTKISTESGGKRFFDYFVSCNK